MSFIAPFILAGLAAIALPILLHLRKQRPKNKMAFSTLMFLDEDLPITRKRTNLQDILLLILRCLAIALLVFAFARPFIQKEKKDEVVKEGVMHYILIDTSASMRGEPLEKALEQARRLIQSAQKSDQICLSTYANLLTPIISPETAQGTLLSQQKSNALNLLKEINATWEGSNLPLTLTTVNSLTSTKPFVKVHVLSDFQNSGDTSQLIDEFWGENIQIIPHYIQRAPSWTNAGVHLIPTQSDLPKVRIINSEGSSEANFSLQWGALPAMQITVNPGESAIFRAKLTGDDFSFDNETSWVSVEPRLVEIYYPSHSEGSNTAQESYYLDRALKTNKKYNLQFTSTQPSTPPRLTITSGEINTQEISKILEDGGHVLYPLHNLNSIDTLANLLELSVDGAQEAHISGHALFGEIDFKSSLFAPFADPRYSDFSKIHIWKHRILPDKVVAKGTVIASFDNNAPAWVQYNIGAGTLNVLTTSWRPEDSQIALSPKFPAIMNNILQQSLDADQISIYSRVGDIYDTPGITETPQGSSIVLLDPTETTLTTMNKGDLQALGIPLSDLINNPQGSHTLEQLSNEELERQQRIGWWALVAVALFLLIETALSAFPNILRFRQTETAPVLSRWNDHRLVVSINSWSYPLSNWQLLCSICPFPFLNRYCNLYRSLLLEPSKNEG